MRLLKAFWAFILEDMENSPAAVHRYYWDLTRDVEADTVGPATSTIRGEA